LPYISLPYSESPRLRNAGLKGDTIENVLSDLLDPKGDLLHALSYHLKNDVILAMDDRFREVLGSVACPRW
jgi:hypothetical protein